MVFDSKDAREARENRGIRESREERENREVRDAREARMAREERETREDREIREIREARDARMIREAAEEREIRIAREAREAREIHEAREIREMREVREAEAVPLSGNKVNPSQQEELLLISGLPDPNSGKIYQLQIGVFNKLESAIDAMWTAKNAGFNVVTETSGSVHMVIIKDIPAAAVGFSVQKIEAMGLKQIWVRETY